MPLICPECNAENADGSIWCLRCSQPLDPAAEHAVQEENDHRFPFWTILPWTLLAAGGVLFVPHLLHQEHGGKPVAAVSSPSASPQTASPQAASSQTPSSVLVPSVAPRQVVVPGVTAGPALTVTLVSSGRQIAVGAPVTVSAYAAVPAGETATLAVSYSRNHGRKSLLSLTQGSLSSTVWTPTAPGRYRFIASALDSRKASVFSRPLLITAEGPAIKPAPSVNSIPAVAASARVTAPTRVAVKPAAVKQVPVKPRPAPQPYHVAAATFSYRPVAETLAGALRRRGFHAFVRSSPPHQHPVTYKVETGDFVRREDAQKQSRLLLRDGYPSSVFRSQ